MDILQVIKSIADYGITIVLSSIVVYSLFRVLKFKLDSLEAAERRKDHDDKIAMREDIDARVYELICEFLQSHNCDRIQVIEFSNTVTSVAYLPFRYMSCTYETIEYGQSAKASLVDKLSTSLFCPLLSKLSKEPYVKLNEASARELSGSVYDLFKQMSGFYMVSAMLKSEKQKCIGFVSFYKSYEPTKKDCNDLVILQEKLSLLLGVLDV